jgi:hypothetical protein
MDRTQVGIVLKILFELYTSPDEYTAKHYLSCKTYTYYTTPLKVGLSDGYAREHDRQREINQSMVEGQCEGEDNPTESSRRFSALQPWEKGYESVCAGRSIASFCKALNYDLAV